MQNLLNLLSISFVFYSSLPQFSLWFPLMLAFSSTFHLSPPLLLPFILLPLSSPNFISLISFYLIPRSVLLSLALQKSMVVLHNRRSRGSGRWRPGFSITSSLQSPQRVHTHTNTHTYTFSTEPLLHPTVAKLSAKILR